MGRYSLVNKRLASGELIAPFAATEVKCKQKYYVATLSEKHNERVKLFIQWLLEEAALSEDHS